MPRKIRDPAMPMYGADWMSSRTIQSMNAEQERGFLRLLLHAWLSGDCTLNDDPNELAALSLLGDKWHGPDGEKISRCFSRKNIGGVAKLVNEKLFLLWKERRKKSKAGREGGLKSGLSRSCDGEQKGKHNRSKRKGDGEANGTAKGNLTSSSTSTSSFASKSIIDDWLKQVKSETLADLARLLRWFDRASSAGAIDGSEYTRNSIAALAIRCRARGRNGGAALFVNLVRGGKFDHANSDEFEAAVTAIREHLREVQGPTDSQVAELIAGIGLISEDSSCG